MDGFGRKDAVSRIVMTALTLHACIHYLHRKRRRRGEMSSAGHLFLLRFFLLVLGFGGCGCVCG